MFINDSTILLFFQARHRLAHSRRTKLTTMLMYKQEIECEVKKLRMFVYIHL